MPDSKCALSFRFRARTDNLPEIRRTVRETAALHGCDPEILDSIVLAVNEACMNIIQHAYRAEDAGDIVLEIEQEHHALIIRLTDFAEPIDPATCRSRDLDDIRPGGLGTHFIRAVMDEVQYLRPSSGQGNILQMKKNCNSQTSHDA